jgi:ribonuclease E
MAGQQPFSIERGEQVHSIEQARAIASQPTAIVAAIEDDEDEDTIEDAGEEEAGEGISSPAEGLAGETESAEHGERGEGGRRRRRRRRRGRHGEPRESDRRTPHEAVAEPALAHEGADEESGEDEDSDEPALSSESQSPGTVESGAQNEERRRRRRGRRGGRRGRRDHEGNAPAALENGHTSIDPDLANAVADFGGPPPEHAHPEHSPEPQQPSPTAASEQPEPIRRRSTVREPAPVGDVTPESPSSAPASGSREIHPAPDDSTAPKADDTGQRRKTGWWSRRLAGGDTG